MSDLDANGRGGGLLGPIGGGVVTALVRPLSSATTAKASDGARPRSGASSNGVFLTGCSFNSPEVSNFTVVLDPPPTHQLRRFPQLGERLRGCKSSPTLARRSLPTPCQDVAYDAAVSTTTVSSFAAAIGAGTSLKGSDQASSKPANRGIVTGSQSNRRIQQGTAPVYSRMHREEVLERDRQRQRQLYGWGEQRNIASPARSHSCSLFFAQVPNGGDIANELPEPFKLVARPPTGERSGNSASPTKKKNAQTEIADADAVLERDEFTQLNQMIDDYAALVKPPTREVDYLTQVAPVKKDNRVDLAATRELERQGPLVLRPLYCRFLLASGVCGRGAGSPCKYHEAVVAFDEVAQGMGYFLSASRTAVCNVIINQLVSKSAPVKDPNRDPNQAQQKDPRIYKFFRYLMPMANKHLDGRRKRLEALCARTEKVSELAVPDAVLAECAADNLWPPLPPRSTELSELAHWTSGVRQWEDELLSQSTSRLLALRAHTDAVSRGELLSCQLLEPEVLHFVARFKPLFSSLFAAYQDWPTPAYALISDLMPSTKKAAKDSQPDTDELALGHMSFPQFFRFCVDFGLYPDHANFEELRGIYANVESMYKLPSIKQFKPMEEETDGGAPSTKNAKHALPAAALAKLKTKKMQLVVAKATAAATSAAEELLPRVNLSFFEKPLALMNIFEMQTVSFFAAVDEWLSERFLRLADVVNRSDETEDDAAQNMEVIEAQATAAALVAVGIENGEFVPDPEAKSSSAMRTKQEEEAALRAATRSANLAATVACQSVRPVKMISASGLLEVAKTMKAAVKPSEAEVEDMFRLLKGGPNENGQWGPAVADDSTDSNTDPLLPVFQLDKVLRAARDTFDKARRYSCSLMKIESERTEEETQCFEFFEEIDKLLLQKSESLGPEERTLHDPFADVMELTPEVLLEKAEELGVPNDLLPAPEDLARLLAEVVGRRECLLEKRLAYRALALTHEGRRLQMQRVLGTRLHCLTSPPLRDALQIEGPTESVFGLAAFVEGILKIALHRLGSKGSTEIQRGSPAWWKCTWLLTLLTSRFREKLTRMKYETEIAKRAMEGEEKWEEAFEDTLGVGSAAANGTYGANSWLASSRINQSRQPSEISVETSAESETSGTSRPRPRMRSVAVAEGDSLSVSGNTPRESSGGRSGGGGSASRASAYRVSHSPNSENEAATQPTKPIHKKRTGATAIQRGQNQDAEVWWRKVQTGTLTGALPRNIPAMDWLATNSPGAFTTEIAESEAPRKKEESEQQFSFDREQSRSREGRRVADKRSVRNTPPPTEQKTPTPMPFGTNVAAISADGICNTCKQQLSIRGWGNPECVTCGGIDSRCLPIDSSLFRVLLREPGASEEEEEMIPEDFREFGRRLSMSSLRG